MYSDTGETIEPGDATMIFSDGTLQFVDNMETVIVCATKQSKAVVLVEFRDKIVAAFMLSSDRGMLVKHLNERGGYIPIGYKNTAIALLVLPGDQPFIGQIRVKSMGEGENDQTGQIRIGDMHNPRIYVPETMMVMYQHLRNEEKTGKRPVNKYTFAQHELSLQTNKYPMKNIGKLGRIFSEQEAMKWLEKATNFTPIEKSLQAEFVLGGKNVCAIFYPKQQCEYVQAMCKSLGFSEKPQFDENETFELSSSSATDGETIETNSEDGSDESKTVQGIEPKSHLASFGVVPAMDWKTVSIANASEETKLEPESFGATSLGWTGSAGIGSGYCAPPDEGTTQNLGMNAKARSGESQTVQGIESKFHSPSFGVVPAMDLKTVGIGSDDIQLDGHCTPTKKKSKSHVRKNVSAKKAAEDTHAHNEFMEQNRRLAQESFARLMEFHVKSLDQKQNMLQQNAAMAPDQNKP
ncbi:uncharacterized protein LOC129572087 [Sitodiplosis mosellana]|uniref:uncharacterized protein LOC129572087 n=1 Tax=Sitodiplosis mosellana TaxID=263140 RepID=UPI00244512E7|nr:uncharacterized protein LOC129572087 [Sitodiplosis mosellana]